MTVKSWEEVPSFRSEKEESDFWRTHTPSERLLEEMRELPREILPPGRPRTRPVAVRFDDFTLRRIKALAAKRHKGYQTLLKEFVSERLYEEESRETGHGGGSNPGFQRSHRGARESVALSTGHETLKVMSQPAAYSGSFQRTRPGELDIQRVLQSEEYSGRIERKLSLLGTHKPVDSKDEERRAFRTIVEAAVALGNSSPEQDLYLVFGQRDNGSIAGEVDPAGRPLTPEEVKRARDRITDLLMQVGLVVAWHSHVENGRRLWISEFSGRKRGSWYTTGDGAILIRSGDKTFPADPDMVSRWVAERLQAPTAMHDAALERLHHLQSLSQALASLQDAADSAALDAPLGPPTSWTIADRVAMAPAEQRWLDYWSALRGLDLSIVGLPAEALPVSRQLIREQRPPTTAKDLLPTAAAELRQALESAWAEVNRLAE